MIYMLFYSSELGKMDFFFFLIKQFFFKYEKEYWPLGTLKINLEKCEGYSPKIKK